MGGGAQELEKKTNFSSNEKVREVGGGAQEFEEDQISAVMRRSGKWAAGPRT